jgi:S-adenosylmethionine:diacylglycerol 3-amino-3-carboxypropyl transferase
VSAYDDLVRDYRTTFLRYLPRREESAMHAGYELGRAALASGRSLLDVVRVHHAVLIEVLRESPGEEMSLVAGAASDFLTEVLASYAMAQPGAPAQD